VESSCECNNENLGSIIGWEMSNGYITCGLMSCAQLLRIRLVRMDNSPEGVQRCGFQAFNVPPPAVKV
jgi:hypothetical protein